MSELYATPYGKWSSSTDDGQIRLEYQFGTAEIADFLKKTQEKAVYPTLELPRDGVCVWAVPGEKMVPLGQISVPMVPQAVRTLAGKILDELETLHKNGLAMADFSPWLVWVTDDFKEVALFPTPSLEPQVKLAPNGTTAMPFAAADWERPVGSPNPVTADIYGFGCLLWFLLTGTSRKTSQMLASEFDPSLAAWDAFFDGCTRNNPARRFQTPEQVRSQIPTGARPTPRPVVVPPPVPVPSAPAKTEAKPASQLLSRRNLLIGGAGVVGLGALVALTRSCGSGVPGLGTPYRRGYGDTILSYQDRNYEGAKWVKAHTFQEKYYHNRVFGWDDDHYWIHISNGSTINQGSLIEYLHHTYNLKLKEIDSEVYCVFSDTEFVTLSTFYNDAEIYYVNSTGARLKSFELERDGVDDLFKIDSNLFIAHTYSGIVYYNMENNSVSFISPTDDKFYIHDEENTPDHRYHVQSIQCVKTISPGHAFGMYDSLLVEYKDNLWRKVRQCPFAPNVSYADFRGDTLKGWIAAGNEGQVFRYTDEGPFQMDIARPSKETSMNIVQVWGVNMNKFWAMDTCGTIWQWENNQWRQVVRGLLDYSSEERDFEFDDTWVSPTGIAYGITEDALYKLEI